MGEHALAWQARVGIRQARWRGREQTEFQLQLAASAANLRRTWNWGGTVAPTVPPYF